MMKPFFFRFWLARAVGFYYLPQAVFFLALAMRVSLMVFCSRRTVGRRAFHRLHHSFISPMRGWGDYGHWPCQSIGFRGSPLFFFQGARGGFQYEVKSLTIHLGFLHVIHVFPFYLEGVRVTLSSDVYRHEKTISALKQSSLACEPCLVFLLKSLKLVV